MIFFSMVDDLISGMVQNMICINTWKMLINSNINLNKEFYIKIKIK